MEVTRSVPSIYMYGLCRTCATWSELSSELEDTDRRTAKLMTIYNRLHPRANVDRLYVPEQEGGTGLFNTQESVHMKSRV